jgi:surfactin synthase thioesterase subunit
MVTAVQRKEKRMTGIQCAVRHAESTQRYAPIRLFILPYAGAGFYVYQDFMRYLPDWIHPVPLDLPGHGRRMKEELLTDIHALADDICAQMNDDLTDPYAFFGHSMGATLAYLAAKAVVERGKGQPPLHLFLSGSAGPDKKEQEPIYTLPKEAFWDAVRNYGGMPEEIFSHEELKDFFTPILRADFQAVQTYGEYTPEPLNIPMTVMLGTEDTLTSGRDMDWKSRTTREVTIHRFEGGHFFLFDHLPEIGRIISECLTGVST